MQRSSRQTKTAPHTRQQSRTTEDLEGVSVHNEEAKATVEITCIHSHPETIASTAATPHKSSPTADTRREMKEMASLSSRWLHLPNATTSTVRTTTTNSQTYSIEKSRLWPFSNVPTLSQRHLQLVRKLWGHKTHDRPETIHPQLQRSRIRTGHLGSMTVVYKWQAKET